MPNDPLVERLNRLQQRLAIVCAESAALVADAKRRFAARRMNETIERARIRRSRKFLRSASTPHEAVS
jgi:hypothetical protein